MMHEIGGVLGGSCIGDELFEHSYFDYFSMAQNRGLVNTW